MWSFKIKFEPKADNISFWDIPQLTAINKVYKPTLAITSIKVVKLIMTREHFKILCKLNYLLKLKEKLTGSNHWTEPSEKYLKMNKKESPLTMAKNEHVHENIPLQERIDYINKMAAKNRSTPEENQKELDRINQIARRPENLQKLIDYLIIGGQIKDD